MYMCVFAFVVANLRCTHRLQMRSRRIHISANVYFLFLRTVYLPVRTEDTSGCSNAQWCTYVCVCVNTNTERGANTRGG